MAVDKLIVTNVGALRTKYGAGFARVQGAIDNLIAKDAASGLHSVLVGLDDPQTMAGLAAPAVTNPADPSQNKAGVDALYVKFSSPPYILILGAWDIIPHQDLANPINVPGNNPPPDPDPIVFSDLPYACEAAYSKAISDFKNPTRVVGRIPDVIGNGDPVYFEQALTTAANYVSKPATFYQDFFAISTATWNASADHTLLEIFGSSRGLNVVPPASSLWPQTSLDSPSHFIDCHGRSNQPAFLGESLEAQPQFPVALDAAYLLGKVKPGTVVAAECCYGAQLYNPVLSNGQLGFPNQYLKEGAYGYFGSTTSSYGQPTQFTGWADNLCRYFFKRILTGASLGRATLLARQDYLSKNSTFTAIDSKTFAQFILLGDPALTPVSAPAQAALRFALANRDFATMDAKASERADRLERRMALFQNGAALGDSVNIADKPSAARIRPAMLNLLKAEAAKLGLDQVTFARYQVTSARAKPRGAKVKSKPAVSLKAVYRVTGKRGVGGPDGVALAGLEVHEFDHGVTIYPFVSKGFPFSKAPILTTQPGILERKI